LESDGKRHWGEHFDERQWRLIGNCRLYAECDPAGLPGHQLMLIVAKMADLLEADGLIKALEKANAEVNP
jgi:hypothetical protein